MRKIKVVVVEDSVMFRELLVRNLLRDSLIDVVAVAGDPYEARDAIIKYEPDVMTLDIELPRMSGLEFLRKLMPQHPLPIVVISSLNDKVFDALSAGAVDFVNKPGKLNAKQLDEFMQNELVTKVKIAATAKVGNLKHVYAKLPSVEGQVKTSSDVIVAIGASTGGTEAIYEVIKNFNRDIPGIVVVQHMPSGFTKMYAERLNNQCKVVVKEARTGDRVIPGQVLIAPGDAHLRVVKINGAYQVECKPGPRVNGHCPSVDVLFESVARTAGSKAVGIILTGMGNDGAEGLLTMRKAGAKTIGQDAASSVVYGMPKEAYCNGAVEYQVGLMQIAQKTYSVLNTM